MKKIRCLILIPVLIYAISQTGFASDSFANISGFTDSRDAGITVLVLKPDATPDELDAEDILYIDQGEINSDGTYILRLPINLDYETLNLYSNVSGFSLNSPETSPKTVYVSADGDDANSGEDEEHPLKSLKMAYAKAFDGSKIVFLSDYTFCDNPLAYSGIIELAGKSDSIKLKLPQKTNLSGGLKFSNITLAGSGEIFANGHALEIGSDVTFDSRMTVYGGADGRAVTGDTHLTLRGGTYKAIYGGGKNAPIIGSTNVMLGGTLNPGDGINDSDAAISPCYAYGGGLNGEVTGKTNLTLAEDAVVKYLVGGGTDVNGKAYDTNIFVKGGKVMNVYGGFVSGGEKSFICNTHITMTGGCAEALFGGNEGASLKGNTYLTLLGGEVTRRVFSGCYNEWDDDNGTANAWKSSRHVIGTTNLTIGPDVRLNTTNGLSIWNEVNVGVFAGSRQPKEGFDGEVNTLIFINGAYEKQKDVMGEQSWIAGWLKDDTFYSIPHYTIAAGAGGEVIATDTAGRIELHPDSGNCAVIGGRICSGGTAEVQCGLTNVVFQKDNRDFGIASVKPVLTEGGVSAGVAYKSENKTVGKSPNLIIALCDESGERLLAVSMQTASEGEQNVTVNLNADLEAGKTYMVKAAIWNGETVQPLTEMYKICISK